MTRWPLRSCAVIAFFTWVVPVYGQTRPAFIPEVTEIRRLLESTTPRDQAWGAWLAAQARASELVPVLREVASAHRAAAPFQDSLTTSAALDAIIQLGTPQPAAWARTFFDRWPAESLILLSRADDDATAELMDLAASQKGIRWLTAANLLLKLKRRPPGFAALLLGDLEISADLAIVSNENQGFGTGGGVGVASAADGAPALVPGFPPLAHYYLDQFPYPGAVVLATGPKTIFFMRHVSSPGETAPPTWHDTTAPTWDDRFDYIAALFDTPGQTLIKKRETRTVVGRNGLSVEKESAAFREDILKRHATLVAAFVGKGLLTQEEAARLPQPRIVIIIHDLRKQPSRDREAWACD